jgi:hypothetical protein
MAQANQVAKHMLHKKGTVIFHRGQYIKRIIDSADKPYYD